MPTFRNQMQVQWKLNDAEWVNQQGSCGVEGQRQKGPVSLCYLDQSGTLYQSSNNYPNDDLLPSRVTLIFRSREIVTASGNRIYLFSVLQESFHFRIVILIC